jgi:hypothetical protein
MMALAGKMYTKTLMVRSTKHTFHGRAYCSTDEIDVTVNNDLGSRGYAHSDRDLWCGNSTERVVVAATSC